MEIDCNSILDRMRYLCSMREYCTSDIRTKVTAALEKASSGNIAECAGTAADSVAAGEIISAGDVASMAEAIVDRLKKDGYLDDLRFASSFARDKAVIAGWGRTKIRHALSVKGLERPVIEDALAAIDDEASEGRLLKVLKVKYASLKGRPDCRQRLVRFGLGRGYSYDEIKKELDIILDLTENQDEEIS